MRALKDSQFYVYTKDSIKLENCIFSILFINETAKLQYEVSEAARI